MFADERHQIATRIAQKLRDADVGCELVEFLPTEAAVVRRDRIVVVLALILLSALAWSYLLWLSADMGMGGMDMSGFRMIPSGMGLMVPAHTPWPAIEFAFVFVMWTVMMVGMMVPSAVPIIVMYARVGRYTQAQGTPLGATAYFSIGYVLVWGVFSLFATLTQWGLERAGLLDDAMASTSNILGAVVFVAAGTYQWTRIKYVCLTQCQMPFAFLIRHGGLRRDAPGALILGLRHGAYCVGCCWMLMTLLFVGGVMNVLWMGLLALVVLLEKVISLGPTCSPRGRNLRFGRRMVIVNGNVLTAWKHGTLSKDEYLSFVEKRFKAADPDNDGTVSAAEFKTGAGQSLSQLLS